MLLFQNDAFTNSPICHANNSINRISALPAPFFYYLLYIQKQFVNIGSV